MQFANYSDFRTWVLKMIDGDDANTGAIAQDTLDLLIAMGESRVYHGTDRQAGLRASSMQAALTGVVASNAVALPTDCLALEIVWFDPEKPLEAVSESDLRDRSRWNHGGDVRQYAQSGDTLIFAPEASDGANIGGRYYKRPADILTGGLHATFNRYPEVFLFGALSESAPFLGEDSRLTMWRGLLDGWLNSSNAIERNRAYSGSRLIQKAR
jgi:hypothetical protein